MKKDNNEHKGTIIIGNANNMQINKKLINFSIESSSNNKSIDVNYMTTGKKENNDGKNCSEGSDHS